MKRVVAIALFFVAGFATEASHPFSCTLMTSASVQERRRRCD